MGAIYQITNCADDQETTYIGSTMNLRRRWCEHHNELRRGVHGNPHLQAAWDKYGESAFEFGVLEYLDSQEELHLAEQFWMDVYREEDRSLYNCGLVAQRPCLGYKHSEAAKEKIRRAQKGRTHTKEARQKMSESHKGKILSKEHRRKLSKAISGEGNPMWGKHHTEETREKIGKTKAKPYPAFTHCGTGKVIPAGINMKSMCRKYKLHPSHMRDVATGKTHSHKEWILMKEM